MTIDGLAVADRVVAVGAGVRMLIGPFDPAPYEIRRVDGTSHIVMWFRAPVGIRVGVRLTNAEGQSDTGTQMLP